MLHHGVKSRLQTRVTSLLQETRRGERGERLKVDLHTVKLYTVFLLRFTPGPPTKMKNIQIEEKNYKKKITIHDRR